MRLSAAQYLPTRQVMGSLLSDIAWGQAAQEVLPDLDGRINYVIGLLPTHMKVLSDTKTGTRLVETFLNWEGGPVVAIPAGAAAEATWSYVEHGKKHTGVTQLRTDGLHLEVGGRYPEHANAPITKHPRGTSRYERLLEAMGRDAQRAEWELTIELERYVLFSLETASRRVAREIEGDVNDTDIADYYADRDNHGVVDRITLDKISGQMLFGDGATAGTSVVRRLISRCATTAINNQPIPSYLAVNIYSQAETHIRREIGDPHIGRKIRRVARESGAVDLESLLASYRAAYPKDVIGSRRVFDALTAGKTIDSRSTSLTQWGTGELSSLEDDEYAGYSPRVRGGGGDE